MTDLTEYTWYYCEMKDGDIQMLERGSDYFLSGDVPLLNNEVKQVLAPVPSYEEWQAKLEENTKLKELLKECKKWLTALRVFFTRESSINKINDLIKRIDEVLR